MKKEEPRIPEKRRSPNSLNKEEQDQPSQEPTPQKPPSSERPNRNTAEGNAMDKRPPREAPYRKRREGNAEGAGARTQRSSSFPPRSSSPNQDRKPFTPRGNAPGRATGYSSSRPPSGPHSSAGQSTNRTGGTARNSNRSQYPSDGLTRPQQRGRHGQNPPQKMPYFPSDHVVRDRYHPSNNQYEGLPKDDEDDFDDDLVSSKPRQPAKAAGDARGEESAPGKGAPRSKKPFVARQRSNKQDSVVIDNKEQDSDDISAEGNTSEKLHKIMAKVGLTSRREAEEWIAAGRVMINGVVAGIGDRASAHDRLEVDGKKVIFELDDETTSKRFILYHKPEGEVCTRTDPEGRPTVYDRLPPLKGERWVVVGRLDMNTSGLLLFTTNGNFANRLMHPSSMVEREYAVRVFGEISDTILQNLSTGIELEDGPAKFSRIVDAGGEGRNHWFHITLSEGRNREVRRMWESQGLTVSRLIRVRYGHLVLPRDLRAGQWVELEENDINKLSDAVSAKVRRGAGLFGRGRVVPAVASPAAITADDRLSARRGGFLRRRRY